MLAMMTGDVARSARVRDLTTAKLVLLLRVALDFTVRGFRPENCAGRTQAEVASAAMSNLENDKRGKLQADEYGVGQERMR